MNHKPKNRFGKLLGAGLVLACLLLTTACSGIGQEPKSTDEVFLEDLVSGWVARWDFLADPEQELTLDDPKYAEKYKDQLTQAVNIEVEKLQPHLEKSFEDTELQSRATDYVGLLEESIGALQFLNVDNVKYDTMWANVYDRRTIAILEFVDDYKLELPDEHATTITEMRTNAELAASRAATETALSTALCALDWQLVSNDDEYYTYFDYSAAATNSSDTDFSNVHLEISVIDEHGINKGTQYASVSNWRAGQTASFELLFMESQFSSLDVFARWETSDGQYGELVDVCKP